MYRLMFLDSGDDPDDRGWHIAQMVIPIRQLNDFTTQSQSLAVIERTAELVSANSLDYFFGILDEDADEYVAYYYAGNRLRKDEPVENTTAGVPAEQLQENDAAPIVITFPALNEPNGKPGSLIVSMTVDQLTQFFWHINNPENRFVSVNVMENTRASSPKTWVLVNIDDISLVLPITEDSRSMAVFHAAIRRASEPANE